MTMDLVVAAFIDPPEMLDASVTPIPAKSGATLQIVASLPKTAHQIQIHNGIGTEFIGIYKGAVSQEQLIATTGVMGESKTNIFVPRGTRISIRSFGSSPLASGSLLIVFLGLS